MSTYALAVAVRLLTHSRLYVTCLQGSKEEQKPQDKSAASGASETRGKPEKDPQAESDYSSTCALAAALAILACSCLNTTCLQEAKEKRRRDPKPGFLDFSFFGLMQASDSRDAAC